MNVKGKIFATAAVAALAISMGSGVSAQTPNKDLTVEIIADATNAQFKYFFVDSSDLEFNNGNPVSITSLGGATLTGEATIYVVDARLTPLDVGFQISVAADGPFDRTGGGVPLPADSARIVSVGAPVGDTGAPYNSAGNVDTHVQAATVNNAPIGSAVNIVNGVNGAHAQFTQDLNLDLTIPANTPAGTYTTTLVITGLGTAPN